MNDTKYQSLSENPDSGVTGQVNPGSITGNTSSSRPSSSITTEKISAPDLEYKTSFIDQQHLYIRGYIQAADQKATFYFAFFAAIIGYSETKGFLKAWVVNIYEWKLYEALSCVSSVLLLFAAFGCLWVVKPRLFGSKRGLVFFNAITEFESQSEYFSEISTRPALKIFEEKVKHCYDLSKVCSSKYRTLGISLRVGGTGFALLIFVSLLS